MSHSKERKEKICLNCGTALYGFYCHQCGQDNIEPKQSVWHLINHFFADITHFDGKFFTTVKDLVIKPGFLSRQYMIGKRASYLNPVRMYVFTSAFFFLVFFTVYNPKKMNFGDKDKPGNVSNQVLNLDSAKREALKDADNADDSAEIEKTYLGIKKGLALKKSDTSGAQRDRVKLNNFDGHSSGLPDLTATVDQSEYKSIEAYDSAEAKLPEAQRDGLLTRTWRHKKIEIEARYREDKKGFIKEWAETFLHNFPKLLFLSLPLFAMLLKLLYVRRKQFYYVDHGIFSIHLYIYSFLALLLLFGIAAIKRLTDWGFLGFFTAAIAIFSFYYYYKAMRVFYGQRRAKTVVKYFTLCFMSFILVAFLFCFFILFSVFEI